MALVSFRSPVQKQQTAVGNDQRLLMYRFSKSRSRSCGSSAESYTRPRTPHALQEDLTRSRESWGPRVSHDRRSRRTDFKDSVIIVTNTENLSDGTENGHVLSRNAPHVIESIVDLNGMDVADAAHTMSNKPENTAFSRLDIVSNFFLHLTLCSLRFTLSFHCCTVCFLIIV